MNCTSSFPFLPNIFGRDIYSLQRWPLLPTHHISIVTLNLVNWQGCEAFRIVGSCPDEVPDIILLGGFFRSVLSRVASRRWQICCSSTFSLDNTYEVPLKGCGKYRPFYIYIYFTEHGLSNGNYYSAQGDPLC